MSKRLVHEMAYDAPAEQVLAMLADPAFREEVCDYQRVLRREVTVETTGDGFDVTIDQYQAAQGIPSFAKKFVGDEINIVPTESWHGPTGDVTVTIPGKPGEMSGTAAVAGSGETCVETVDLTIKVNIPLVGGKIEGLIADLLLKALKAEHKVGREYLAR